MGKQLAQSYNLFFSYNVLLFFLILNVLCVYCNIVTVLSALHAKGFIHMAKGASGNSF